MVININKIATLNKQWKGVSLSLTYRSQLNKVSVNFSKELGLKIRPITTLSSQNTKHDIFLSKRVSTMNVNNNRVNKLLYRGLASATSVKGDVIDSTTLGPQRKPLFNKILIANRGEIAIRVMKTAKKLGIKTVAVYSEADRNALHTKMADEAYCIGAAPSNESYLCVEKIIEVAKKSKAQAIHPGYGFLSENSSFASRLAEENLIFIGPPTSAIVAMGSKSESKAIMEAAGVPIVPGYHGENQSSEYLLEQAKKIGFPVLIKAVLGGGGKGMRIVHDESEFMNMLDSARREAIKAFSDDRVLVEKYLTTPRHVEVQVFADKYGEAVHLFERDCSVQRRHQKILEEAPAPNLEASVRAELGAKAVAAAKAVGYVGAGTVEFIFDNETQQFYFMEMNTRLQVEHPITEMVTGVDLVQWQLEIASGSHLPLNQSQIKCDGHAFEARIYAENPRKGFLPDVGPLVYLTTPTPSENLRVETGVLQGDEVSLYYDPMIAKLVVKGRDRDEALRMLRKALKQYRIVGLNTNLDFLYDLACHPKFIEGEVETGFIKKYEHELFPPVQNVSQVKVIQASLRLLAYELELQSKLSQRSTDPNSPWTKLNHYQPIQPTTTFKFDFLHEPTKEKIQVLLKPSYIKNNAPLSSYKVQVQIQKEEESELKCSDHEVQLFKYEPSNQTIQCEIDQHLFNVAVVHQLPNPMASNQQHKLTLFDIEDSSLTLTCPIPSYLNPSSNQDLEHSILSPMPCKLIHCYVSEGQKVEAGQPLFVLEAMKMEHVIKAPKDAVIDKVLYKDVGTLVPDGVALVTFKDEES